MADIVTKTIDFSMVTILNWMSRHGVGEIETKYSGGGDSGCTDEINPDIEIDLDRDFVMKLGHQEGGLLKANLDHIREKQFGVIKTPIRQLIDEVAWEVCEYVAGGNGWVNDAGGTGVVNIKADGTVSINHTEYGYDDNAHASNKILDLSNLENKSEKYVLMAKRFQEIADLAKEYPNNEVTINARFDGDSEFYIDSDDEAVTEDITKKLPFEVFEMAADVLEEFVKPYIDESGAEIDHDDVDNYSMDMVIRDGKIYFDLSTTTNTSEGQEYEWSYAKYVTHNMIIVEDVPADKKTKLTL